MIGKEIIKTIRKLVCEEHILKNHRNLLDKTLGGNTFWCYISINAESREVDIDFVKRSFRKPTGCYRKLKKKRKIFLETLKKESDKLKNSIEKNEIYFFSNKGLKNCVVFPLSKENEVYALIMIGNISTHIDDSLISVLRDSKILVNDSLNKEYELRELKQSLGPRCIALSTIHTVHRIISSTLELGELLPKIARLCIQVVRANRCTINLVDTKGDYLVPEITIDIRDSKARSKKIRLGKGNIGRVAKTGKAYKSNKCICMPLLDSNIIGTITVRDKQGGGKFTVFDEEILYVLAEQSSIAIKNSELYEDQKRMVVESVKSLSSLLNIQIPSPYIQDIGFVEIIEAIGGKAKFNQSEMNTLRYAAMLRNVARVGVPGEILLKPSQLTEPEYALIKNRIKEIIELIKPLQVLKPAIPILVHHRERYDGTGYPSGLEGKNIPLGARIMTLVDSFEAMISSRPYKGAMDISTAVEEIKRHKGTQFDPDIVNLFLELVEEGVIQEIVKAHRQNK